MLYCTEILIFPSNSAKTLTSFFSEFSKMEIREDNSHTTICDHCKISNYWRIGLSIKRNDGSQFCGLALGSHPFTTLKKIRFLTPCPHGPDPLPLVDVHTWST